MPLEHPEKGLGVTFISNDQTPEVLQPRKQPPLLHLVRLLFAYQEIGAILPTGSPAD